MADIDSDIDSDIEVSAQFNLSPVFISSVTSPDHAHHASEGDTTQSYWHQQWEGRRAAGPARWRLMLQWSRHTDVDISNGKGGVAGCPVCNMDVEGQDLITLASAIRKGGGGGPPYLQHGDWCGGSGQDLLILASVVG